MKWFRFYGEVVDDPKVQLLPDRLFKTWVSLLCLASRNGGQLPPALKDVAYALRCTERQAASRIDEMVAAGLFEHEGMNIVPHNWNGRQYKSDDSGSRVKSFRERKRNGDVTAQVTPPETEAETEQNRTEADAQALPPLAIAQKVAVECLLPRNPGLLHSIAGAIEFLEKHEKKSPNQAVEFLIEQVNGETSKGPVPNRFWFDDRKWRKPVVADGPGRGYIPLPKDKEK